MKKASPRPKSSMSDSAALHHPLIINKLPGYFLLLCLVATFYFMFQILAPFLTTLFVAGVLTIAFYPAYRRILKFFGNWERSASLFTCILVVLLTVLPIAIFVILLAGEGESTYQLIQMKMNSGVFDPYIAWLDKFLIDARSKIESIVSVQQLDVKSDIINLAQSLSGYLVGQTAVLVKGLSGLLFKFLIMLFAMFYFFKDGDRLVDYFGRISPLPKVHEVELFNKIGSMVKAIMVGVFLTAIAQGLVGGIGFAIAGISSPVFWGTAIALFSLVPMVGTAIIWVPAAIILAIMGSYGAAIFIFLWGMLVIGSVDNILRPYLIGGKAHTYPLMTFFVILGGIWTMGFKGIIVGPLVLMALISFLHIYEAEYSKVLKK